MGQGENWTMDNGTLGQWTVGQTGNTTIRQEGSRTMDKGTMDTDTKAQWDIRTMETHGYRDNGQLDNAAMRRWDNGTLNSAALDNGTMGQLGGETNDNVTMDAGTMDTRTMGPCDSENGKMKHWRIAYCALGQWDSGAMGRDGHGRRDKAQ